MYLIYHIFIFKIYLKQIIIISYLYILDSKIFNYIFRINILNKINNLSRFFNQFYKKYFKHNIKYQIYIHTYDF